MDKQSDDAVAIDDFSRRFVESRRGIADEKPSTLLGIGVRQTTVVSGRSDAPESCETLSVGTRSLADAHFRQSPPLPIDIERAIYEIEDEVMRIRKTIPTDAMLITTDKGMRPVTVAADTVSSDASVLSIATVEQLYQRLAAIAEGRPVAQDDIPVDAAFVARVLILREFMHHLAFTEIWFSFDDK